ncbi:MAG: hypothetical protein SPG61_02010 [Arcanobacterium sp.]|nr:hypothetical protein [Arcanobacterium sp.]
MMNPKYVLRSQTKLFWAVLSFLIVIFLLVFTYLEPASRATYQPLLIAVGLFGVIYIFLLGLKIELTVRGITITNVFRQTFIPWSLYQECEMHFGLVIVSQNARASEGSFGETFTSEGRRRRENQTRDAVAAFPGRGGFSRVTAHVLNVEQGSVKSIPWHNQGTKKYFVRTAQVISLIRRMQETLTKQNLLTAQSALTEKRVVWHFPGLLVLLISLILIVCGIYLLNI